MRSVTETSSADLNRNGPLQVETYFAGEFISHIMRLLLGYRRCYLGLHVPSSDSKPVHNKSFLIADDRPLKESLIAI